MDDSMEQRDIRINNLKEKLFAIKILSKHQLLKAKQVDHVINEI